jgi:hypothetical protein
VLHLRIRFFEALGDRINALSQLRSRFVASRDAFRARPIKFLLDGIEEGKSHKASFYFLIRTLPLTSGSLHRFSARGHTYDGMLSKLGPLFEDIETYYDEINVALLREEERLREIYRSLRVTPGDKLRWQNIRDACREASTLLTAEVGSTYLRFP